MVAGKVTPMVAATSMVYVTVPWVVTGSIGHVTTAAFTRGGRDMLYAR